MSPLQLTIIRALRLPFAFVVLINVLYLMQFEGLWNLNSVCGIRPREWEGILGIITSPLMHGSWEHVFNNSLPLLVLGAAIFYFYPTLALRTIPWIWLASGVMVWFTARLGTNHIGASGLVYGLVTFLFFSASPFFSLVLLVSSSSLSSSSVLLPSSGCVIRLRQTRRKSCNSVVVVVVVVVIVVVVSDSSCRCKKGRGALGTTTKADTQNNKP